MFSKLNEWQHELRDMMLKITFFCSSFLLVNLLDIKETDKLRKKFIFNVCKL